MLNQFQVRVKEVLADLDADLFELVLQRATEGKNLIVSSSSGALTVSAVG